jgi:hypothetical protein
MILELRKNLQQYFHFQKEFMKYRLQFKLSFQVFATFMKNRSLLIANLSKKKIKIKILLA